MGRAAARELRKLAGPDGGLDPARVMPSDEALASVLQPSKSACAREQSSVHRYRSVFVIGFEPIGVSGRPTTRRDALRARIGSFQYFLAPCSSSCSIETEVVPEAVDLMHALVQDGYNPDVAIRKMTPVDKMALVAKEEPFDAKLSRNGFRHDTMIGNLVKICEQARDVFLGLTVAPRVAGIAVDVIKTMRCRFLDTNGGHRIRVDSARSPRPPLMPDRIPQAR
jgi:hypothetical protein